MTELLYLFCIYFRTNFYLELIIHTLLTTYNVMQKNYYKKYRQKKHGPHYKASV